MDLLICGPTAFRYHRIPPQVLALYPPLPDTFADSNHLKLAGSELVEDLLEAPIHRLAFEAGHNSRTKLYKTHCLSNELPAGSTYETDHDLRVTSPAATLLTMAGQVRRTDLLMAAYEMLGSFAVFKPRERTERTLAEALEQGHIAPEEGWKRVRNVDGMGTDLWKRPPLLTLGELESFSRQVEGYGGVKDLRWVAGRVTGETASPFEAQASMLLGLPRASGGEGLTIKNNERIRLSPAARRIYPRMNCYADILIEGRSDNAGTIVECQGRSVHASEAAGISDSDRTTALASMGYEVILLTYDQITNPSSFDVVLDIIARKTGVPRRPKTNRQKAAELELRRNIFFDWSRLAS